MSTHCPRCNTPIFWADTIKGKKMPMDSQPDPAGTFKLTNRPGQNALASSVKGVELATATFLYTCHWTSSPDCKPRRSVVAEAAV